MSTYRIKKSNVFVNSKRSNLKAVKDSKEDETEQFQDRLKTDQTSRSFYNKSSRSIMNKTESLFNKQRAKKNVPHYASSTHNYGFDMNNYYEKPQVKKQNVGGRFKTFDLMGNFACNIRANEQKEEMSKARAQRAKETTETRNWKIEKTVNGIKNNYITKWKFAIISKALEKSIEPCCAYFG